MLSNSCVPGRGLWGTEKSPFTPGNTCVPERGFQNANVG